MTRLSRYTRAALFCALTIAQLSAVSMAQQTDAHAAMEALLGRMPVGTAAAKQALADNMLALGRAGVLDLCNRFASRNEPLDGKALSALHGLVHAASKAGAETQREMVAGVFTELLASDATVDAKRHLLMELRHLGGSEAAASIASKLTTPELCEPAAQALFAIGTPEAAAALRGALPAVTGPQRVTVIFALGRLRDARAVAALLPLAGDADAPTRHAALFALANTGAPRAEDVLRKAALSDDDADCEAARHGLLRFALRLAEAGDKKTAADICTALLNQEGAGDSGIASAAFFELMGLAEDKQAVGQIMAALGHENAKVRTAALRAAAAKPGSDITRALARTMVQLPAALRPPVAELLLQRGDPAALEGVLQGLDDPDVAVRLAAINAVGGLGKRDVAPRLIAFLDKTPAESEAAQAALAVMGDKGLNAALVTALPDVNPRTRRSLLEVLAERDAAAHRDVFLAHAEDADKAVRRAALKILDSFDDRTVVTRLMALLAKTGDAAERTAVERALLEACRTLSTGEHDAVAKELIGAYGKGSAPVRSALVQAVACLAEGYGGALDHTMEARDDADEVRTVALRTLAAWPTPEPMNQLLKLASDTNDMTEHVLALRGAIRMAGLRGDPLATVKALRLAQAAARRPDERKLVLGAVSAVAHPDAIALAATCLGDTQLKSEATAAVVSVGRAMCRPTRILVAFDKRASARPTWMTDWEDTGKDLGTSDVDFRIYAHDATADTITLGGNRAPGVASHYIVLLEGEGGPSDAAIPAMKKALAVIGDAETRARMEQMIISAEGAGDAGRKKPFHVAHVASGAPCRVMDEGVGKSASVYVDRDYTFTSVPADLVDTPYVMMANDDKNRSDAEYLVLTRSDAPIRRPTPAEPAAPKPRTDAPDDGKPVEVTIGGTLITAYHYADAERPYFYPVTAPTGVNVTRHWPMKDGHPGEQTDHRHHRSLWFTHGDVNGLDFWSEGRGPKIVQTSMTVDERPDKTVIFTRSEWRAPDGKVVCTDARRHTVRLDGDTRLIDLDITLIASHGDVVLGDTKEGSMAVRVAPPLRTKGKVARGSMVNSEGGSGSGIWGKRARWCDYFGPIDGKVVGVAIMDHPSNPRHPTTWHARDYGLCAANPFGLSYFEKKAKGSGNMTVKQGESVTFRYRVAVHSGSAEDAGVEAMFREYATAVTMTSLFNGTDFSGWKVPADNTWWRAENGVISVTSGPKKKGSILWTEKAYRDFLLELDFRFGEGTIDSGVFLRTERQQVQLGISGSLKRDMTCSIYVPGKGYPEEAAGVKELLKPGDWNSLKVEVIGSVYTMWLNGKQVLVFEAKQAIPEGPIGLQLHAGKTMAIDFRNVRIAKIE